MMTPPLTSRLSPTGTGLLRYGLVALLLLYGGLKFARFEAEGIEPLLAHSPLLSWMPELFDVRVASAIIGVVEITLGLGILARRVAPTISGVASLGAAGMFLVTLSFLLTTPGVTPWTQAGSLAGGFLVKDLILLGAALYTAGEALHAEARSHNPKPHAPRRGDRAMRATSRTGPTRQPVGRQP